MSELAIKSVPMIALRGLVVFPDMQIHFDVGRSRSIQAVYEALAGERLIFLAAQHDVRDEEPTEEQIYSVGCLARIQQVLKLPGDAIRVMADGLQRARVVTFEKTDPYFGVQVLPLGTVGYPRKSDPVGPAMLRAVKDAFAEYAKTNAKLPPDMLMEVAQNDDLRALCDYIAGNVPFTPQVKQSILEQIHLMKRAELLVTSLQNEAALLALEMEIEQRVRDNMDDNQRDYYLREQIRVISEELGEDDDPKREAEEYRARIDALPASDAVKEKLYREANKLYKMPTGSHEATVVRGYLDAVLDLPFGVYTEDNTDLAAAERMLNEDHYGLQKVKQRILELMAVRALAPDLNGQILCLVGPPGVGKTSIAKSIARCMGRNYVRISLGGVRDEADIRGHRRTYIGSMPGRIMEAVRQSGSQNPLILMDEIDKLGADYKGDPSSALLEVLDPEQNNAFEDHFLEIPFDLSRVLFVLTANTADTIPDALRDRMEIIELSSYTREEKKQIARRHLVPKQIERHGLSPKTFRISDAALYAVIDGYVKEAGVRNLERELARLCRKAAKRLVAGECDRVSVKAADLPELLGPRRFKNDPPAEKGAVGLVNGLAWTSVGGELLPIETAVFKGTGKIQLTGSLGDVMKESAQAAISCIRSRTDRLQVPDRFYQEYDVHIHAPEGAVPKDGPSAGITMATALISAFSGAPVRSDVAMTGEITIRGRVLPIGGLKEKTMAAYKAGMKTVILPRENLPDLSEVEPVVRENLQFVGVSTIDEVLPVAFADRAYEKPAADRKPAPAHRARPDATRQPTGYC